MFEKELEAKFKKIFGLKKATYAIPAPEAREQDCLFIEIEDSKNTIKDGMAFARVTGRAFLFSQGEKLPFGFFSKKIEKADNADTKDLFFSDFESNTRYFQNLVQRGFNFLFLFRGQYDPETGEINEINFSVEESQT